MFMVLLLAAATATPGLHIDPRLDAGLPCPAYSALRARLGTLDPRALEETPGGEALDVSLAWQAQGGAWKLRLSRADGSARLERELRLGQADCPLVAESAALVIDRYLAALREPPVHREKIGAGAVKAPPIRKPPAAPAADIPAPAATAETARPAATSKAPRDPEPARDAAPETPPIPAAPPPASAPAPIATPAPAPAKVVAPPEPPSRAAAAPAPNPPPPTERAKEIVEPEPLAPPPEPGQLSVALGPAGIAGLPSDLRAALWLEAEHPIALQPAPRLAGTPIAFTARFLFLGSASSSQPVIIGGANRGDISARSILLAAEGGPCATKWLRFCAGGVAGLRLISGGSDGGGIFAQSTALLAQPEVGGEVSLDKQLGERLSLRFSLLLGVAPGAASLSIQGGPARQFSTVDLAAGLLLGYQIF